MPTLLGYYRLVCSYKIKDNNTKQGLMRNNTQKFVLSRQVCNWLRNISQGFFIHKNILVCYAKANRKVQFLRSTLINIFI